MWEGGRAGGGRTENGSYLCHSGTDAVIAENGSRCFPAVMVAIIAPAPTVEEMIDGFFSSSPLWMGTNLSGIMSSSRRTKITRKITHGLSHIDLGWSLCRCEQCTNSFVLDAMQIGKRQTSASNGS